jgi:hypothetical protein
LQALLNITRGARWFPASAGGGNNRSDEMQVTLTGHSLEVFWPEGKRQNKELPTL